MATAAKRNGEASFKRRGRVRLVLNTRSMQWISTNSTRIGVYIPAPKRYGVPLFDLKCDFSALVSTSAAALATTLWLGRHVALVFSSPNCLGRCVTSVAGASVDRLTVWFWSSLPLSVVIRWREFCSMQTKLTTMCCELDEWWPCYAMLIMLEGGGEKCIINYYQCCTNCNHFIIYYDSLLG